jgi:hypothetical protein
VATAEESYRRACAVAEELGMQPLVGRCHLGLAELYRKIGVSEPAERHRDVAMGLFDGLGMPFWLDRAKGDYNAGP